MAQGAPSIRCRRGVSRRGGRIWKAHVWAPRRYQARAVETDKLGPDAPRVDKDMDGEGPRGSRELKMEVRRTETDGVGPLQV